MATLLKGAPVVAAMNEETARRCAALEARGVRATLAALRVGEREDDLSYERGLTKRCAAVGVALRRVVLPENVTEEELRAAVEAVNADSGVHGCLIFRPLPRHVDARAVCAALAPEKDVDGVTDRSLASVFTGGGAGFAPCSAQACVELLTHYGVPLSGARVTVVGRSLVVGKPAAMLLDRRNATVTLCNSRTRDLPALCRAADVLVVAIGKRGFIGRECLRAGQTVVDVGIHEGEEGKLCGDVRFDEAEPIVDAITPVPGGVGTVTNSVLVRHVVEAAERAE